MNRTIRQLGTSGAVAGIVVAGILLAACAPPPSPTPRTVYVEPPAPRTTTVEDARSILREEPSGKAALKEAERFQAAGNREAVFLLVKYAARKKVPEAAYEMGRMYDPETHAKGVVLEPNVLVAAQWFRWGARNGHVPSMSRLGLMYKDGILEATGAATETKNGVPEELLGMDATDRSFYWLDKAARAGESTQ